MGEKTRRMFTMENNQQLFASKHFHLEQLGEGVFATTPKRGGAAICNAGIVDLGDRTLVFDSFFTPQAAEDLRTAAETLIGRPIDTVINSHYHNDHVRGNQVFSPATVIMATHRCRELIQTKGMSDLKNDTENAEKRLKALTDQFRSEKEDRKKAELKLWISYNQHIINSLPDIRLNLPNLTFAKQLTLSGSKHAVEIINTGEGHTDNDTVMYVPSEKILFTGDLVFVQCHPYLGDGHPKKWLTTLSRLKDLKITALIPGHGPIGNAKDIDLMV